LQIRSGSHGCLVDSGGITMLGIAGWACIGTAGAGEATAEGLTEEDAVRTCSFRLQFRNPAFELFNAIQKTLNQLGI
jgi:hypothetical protein